jgi:hypothetical protein
MHAGHKVAIAPSERRSRGISEPLLVAVLIRVHDNSVFADGVKGVSLHCCFTHGVQEV